MGPHKNDFYMADPRNSFHHLRLEYVFNSFRSYDENGVIDVKYSDFHGNSLLMVYLECGQVEIESIRELINAGSQTGVV